MSVQLGAELLCSGRVQFHNVDEVRIATLWGNRWACRVNIIMKQHLPCPGSDTGQVLATGATGTTPTAFIEIPGGVWIS